jgi:hypothetical protein
MAENKKDEGIDQEQEDELDEDKASEKQEEHDAEEAAVELRNRTASNDRPFVVVAIPRYASRPNAYQRIYYLRSTLTNPSR